MMIHQLSQLFTVLSLAAIAVAGFYESAHGVFELSASNFNDVVYKSNYTTIVEFYAPWCGYCQKLKPIYKKVGAVSDGLFQAAAVNCDLGENKQLCSGFQVQGYPTLMVFRPPKYDPHDPEKNLANFKTLKHASEVYGGERTLAKIVDFVTSRIKNYVKRISSEDLLKRFLNGRTKTNKNKLLLLTDKLKPSALIKTIAIDFMTDLESAYVTITSKNKKQFLETFGLELNLKLPQIIAIDVNDLEKYHIYEGKFDKESISKFLLKFGNPAEGPLSDRANHLQKYMGTSKKTKSNKKKQTSKSERDEL